MDGVLPSLFSSEKLLQKIKVRVVLTLWMVRIILLHDELLGHHGIASRRTCWQSATQAGQEWCGCSRVSPSRQSLDLFFLLLLNINLIQNIGFSVLYRCSSSVVITFTSELLFQLKRRRNALRGTMERTSFLQYIVDSWEQSNNGVISFYIGGSNI